MAAYRHVASKSELLIMIADDVLDGVTVPSVETGDWYLRLERLELSAFAEVSRVGDLWDLLPSGGMIASERRLGKAVTAILLDAGFEPASAAWAQEAIFGYVLGHMRLALRIAPNRKGRRTGPSGSRGPWFAAESPTPEDRGD